jgi:hypothetical protein
MRIEIEKKMKEDNDLLYLSYERERKTKQTIIIYLHTPHHINENMHPLNGANTTHLLVRVHVPKAFFIKNSNENVKIPKHPYNDFNYTKYSCENLKTSQMQSLFFSMMILTCCWFN